MKTTIDKALNYGILMVLVLLLGHWVMHKFIFHKKLGVFPTPEEVDNAWKDAK